MKWLIVISVGLMMTGPASSQDVRQAIDIGEACLTDNQSAEDCVSVLYQACEDGKMGFIQGAGRGFCDAAVQSAAGMILARQSHQYNLDCPPDAVAFELIEAESRAFFHFAQSKCALTRYQNRDASGSGETARAICLATADLQRAIELHLRSAACGA